MNLDKISLVTDKDGKRLVDLEGALIPSVEISDSNSYQISIIELNEQLRVAVSDLEQLGTRLKEQQDRVDYLTMRRDSAQKLIDDEQKAISETTIG